MKKRFIATITAGVLAAAMFITGCGLHKTAEVQDFDSFAESFENEETEEAEVRIEVTEKADANESTKAHTKAPVNTDKKEAAAKQTEQKSDNEQQEETTTPNKEEKVQASQETKQEPAKTAQSETKQAETVKPVSGNKTTQTTAAKTEDKKSESQKSGTSVKVNTGTDKTSATVSGKTPSKKEETDPSVSDTKTKAEAEAAAKKAAEEAAAKKKAAEEAERKAAEEAAKKKAAEEAAAKKAAEEAAKKAAEEAARKAAEEEAARKAAEEAAKNARYTQIGSPYEARFEQILDALNVLAYDERTRMHVICDYVSNNYRYGNGSTTAESMLDCGYGTCFGHSALVYTLATKAKVNVSYIGNAVGNPGPEPWASGQASQHRYIQVNFSDGGVGYCDSSVRGANTNAFFPDYDVYFGANLDEYWNSRNSQMYDYAWAECEKLEGKGDGAPYLNADGTALAWEFYDEWKNGWKVRYFTNSSGFISHTIIPPAGWTYNANRTMSKYVGF